VPDGESDAEAESDVDDTADADVDDCGVAPSDDAALAEGALLDGADALVELGLGGALVDEWVDDGAELEEDGAVDVDGAAEVDGAADVDGWEEELADRCARLRLGRGEPGADCCAERRREVLPPPPTDERSFTGWAWWRLRATGDDAGPREVDDVETPVFEGAS
jgi:hypothetical protein